MAAVILAVAVLAGCGEHAADDTGTQTGEKVEEADKDRTDGPEPEREESAEAESAGAEKAADEAASNAARPGGFAGESAGDGRIDF